MRGARRRKGELMNICSFNYVHSDREQSVLFQRDEKLSALLHYGMNYSVCIELFSIQINRVMRRREKKFDTITDV